MIVVIEEFRPDTQKRSANDPVNRRRHPRRPHTGHTNLVQLVRAEAPPPEADEGVLPPAVVAHQDVLLRFWDTRDTPARAHDGLQVRVHWILKQLRQFRELAKEAVTLGKELLGHAAEGD